MISFSRYLQQTPTVDAHIHLFNVKNPIKYNSNYDKLVGFMDIEYDTKGDEVAAYDWFIEKYYDKNKHILLATASSPENVIKIFEKHKNVIKGFGELKLYDKYQDKEVPYKKISILRSVCKLSTDNGNLPVYVHWELTNDRDVKSLENTLKAYPSVPIVLCHCGMNGENDEFSMWQCQKLSYMYSNLWLDISYKSLDYFTLNPLKLYNLPMDRMIIGSDLNNKIFGPNHTDQEISSVESKVTQLRSIIPSDKNISSLFRL